MTTHRNNFTKIKTNFLLFQVGRIGLDYKKTLGAFRDVRALDDNAVAIDGRSQEYADALSACHLRSADKLLKLCQVLLRKQLYVISYTES